MTYRFKGFFVRPAFRLRGDIPAGAIWREINSPFIGIGIRLPDDESDEVKLLTIDDILTLSRQLGFETANWVYLDYVCWGGQIDFNHGIASSNGLISRTVKAEGEFAEAAFIQILEDFSIPSDVALNFEPFTRHYWGEQFD